MTTCDCGKRFQLVVQLVNVAQAGLVLYGDCPNCGRRLAISELWRKTARISYRGKFPVQTPLRASLTETKNRGFLPLATQNPGGGPSRDFDGLQEAL